MNKKIIYTAAGVFFITILGYFMFSGGGNGSHEYVAVELRDIVQEVSVTGKVKPVSSASLAFDRVGRISNFNVNAGDKVYAGQILASLENSDLVAELNQAEANVKIQEAKLDELLRGAREEDLQISQAQVDGALYALADAKNGLVEKINDAYTKSDDSIRNRIDRMFNNSKSTNPTLVFVVSDIVLSDQIKFERFIIENLMNDWSNSLGELSVNSDLDKYITEASQNLDRIKSFLDKLSLAVNGLVANSTLSQTTIDSYRSETSTARTNTNTAISNISTANEKLRAAVSSLNVATQQLALKEAGSSDEQIRAQEAALDQARASASGIRAQIGKTVLRSPISGIVAKRDFQVGEIVSANTQVFNVISESEFEIEANVTEADIAKVNIGDTARVTLDAYGQYEIFNVVVTRIDSSETIIEGVATYKTVFQFVEKDDRIKSGMTANIDIMTDKKEGVLAIPQRAISSSDGDRFVEVNNGTEIPEIRKIEVGLRGSDGYTEVVSGLKEGDEIVGLAE